MSPTASPHPEPLSHAWERGRHGTAIASAATTWPSGARRHGLHAGGSCATRWFGIRGRGRAAPRRGPSQQSASHRRRFPASAQRGRGGRARSRRLRHARRSRLRFARCLSKSRGGVRGTMGRAARLPAADCPMGRESRSSQRCLQAAPEALPLPRRRTVHSPSHPSQATCGHCGKVRLARRGWHRAR